MTRTKNARRADRRDVLNIAAALVAVLLLAGLASSAGCAHLSPEERFAVDTTVSIGKDCVAAPVVTCPWTEGGDAFLECLWRQAAPCAGEHIAALAGVAFKWLWEARGVMLAAPATKDLRHLKEADRCVKMIDPSYVEAHCEGEPRQCVGAAVAECIDGAVEGAAP